jgi:hypothetical protein
MIYSINFTGEYFQPTKPDLTGGGYLGKLGKRVVVICSDLFIKETIVDMFRHATKGASCNATINDGVPLAKYPTHYISDHVDNTVVTHGGSQKFYFTIHPELIYVAKQPHELWFASYNDKRKIYFYSFAEYKESNKFWKKKNPLDKIYEDYRNGIYDGYVGLYKSLGLEMDEYKKTIGITNNIDKNKLKNENDI